jgi:hypothetical protein
MSKNKKKPEEIIELNDGYFREALDRTYCIQDHIENVLIGHPAISQTPELKALADKAHDILGDLYLAVAKYMDSPFPGQPL